MDHMNLDGGPRKEFSLPSTSSQKVKGLNISSMESNPSQWTNLSQKELEDKALVIERLLIECKEYMEETGVSIYLCPCLTCRGCKSLSYKRIEEHLFKRGAWESIEQVHDEKHANIDLDQNINVKEMLQDAFKISDEATKHASYMNAQDEDTFTNTSVANEEDFEILMKKACEPLYEGCGLSSLSTTLLLYNLKVTHGWSQEGFSELLYLLKYKILPANNLLPSSLYEAKKSIHQLGLEYNSIHACNNDCVLYRGRYANAQVCPVCNESRWKNGTSKVPQKVLRHFALILRLLKQYRCPLIAKHMRWHVEGKSNDGLCRGAVDSLAWNHIDNTWPLFSQEARNVRLGLAIEGVNPYSDLRSVWSTWPVILINYNLPPWLATKNFFLMLSLLILGPKQVSADKIDVYLQVLVEELQELWQGVQAYDASSLLEEQKLFNLQAILMWTIHDYPAYGLISGCSTKGYIACPECGPNFPGIYSHQLKKMEYIGHRRFLPSNHHMRKLKYAFFGSADYREKPRYSSVDDIKEFCKEREEWLESGNNVNSKDDPSKRHGWKRLSIFYTLPYWEYLLVRYTLDCMHVEKNIAENILKTILRESDKDSVKVRLDMKDMGIRKELWPQPIKEESEKLKLPPAPYRFTKKEEEEFFSFIKTIKVPTGYSASLQKHVASKRLLGMKTHDYHIFY